MTRGDGRLYVRPDGRRLCAACRRAETPPPPAAYRVERCAGCGRTSRVFARRDDGGALCQRCYQPPVAACAVCGRQRPVHRRSELGPVCRACYAQPERVCGACGQRAPWVRRPRAGQPGICAHCDTLPTAACRRCGRTRQVRPTTGLCLTCSARHEACDGCGKVRPVAVRWPTGTYCPTCYQRLRADVRRCPACHDVHPLIGLDDQGRRVCASCAGLDYDYACRRCGATGMLLADHLCADCLATGRINLLLTGSDGTVPAELEPVAAALKAAGSSYAVYTWLSARGPASRVITALAQAVTAAAGEVSLRPVTHDLLDELPRCATVRRLRALLVHTGVLPARPEYLERITPWLDEVLTGLPAQHAHQVRAWVQWTVLRRARRRLRTRPFTEAAAHAVRSNVLSAVEFLTWTTSRGLSLDQLTQSDIDQWVDPVLRAERSRNPHLAREFLRWARGRGLTRPDVDIPPRPAGQTLAPLPETDRWHHLGRCLNDPSLPDHVRAAGALLLLFGIPISRIARLRTGDLRQDGPKTFLRLRDHDLAVPAAVADLLNRCRRPGTTWLFPGAHPGTHVTYRLGRALTRHGFPDAARARATALIDLTARLPAPVLADLLGIHINTALVWARYAQDDWATYLQARQRRGSVLPATR